MNKKTLLPLLTIGLMFSCIAQDVSTNGIIETKQDVVYWKPAEPPFENREHAGQLLGKQILKEYDIEELKDAVVLGCPRGGMALAKAVVEAIRNAGGFPALDLVICRKIPLPNDEECGIGSVTEQGDSIYVDRLVKLYDIDIKSDVIQKTAEKARKEVMRRVEAYRQGIPPVSMEDKIVIIVDGIVSGSTMIACIKSVREFSHGKTKRIIIATPLLAEKGKKTIVDLGGIPREDICTAVVATPPPGSYWNSDDFYKLIEFSQMTDQEVREILQTFK